MNKISRRSLAKFAADELVGGASASDVAQHLAGVLAETGRAGDVDFLLGDIAWELERRGLLANARVTSAVPITKELGVQIKAQVKKAAGAQDVLLDNQVDESIIGGLRVETSSRVWDNTVKRKLSDLREGV